MTREQRSFSLGRDGEQSWRQLGGAYRIDDCSGRALVVSESAELRGELRRRLASLGPLHRVAPGPDILSEIHELAQDSAGEQLPIVWVEAPARAAMVVEDAWGRALQALNRDRDLIHDRGPLFLVLAGDSELRELEITSAPPLAES